MEKERERGYEREDHPGEGAAHGRDAVRPEEGDRGLHRGQDPDKPREDEVEEGEVVQPMPEPQPVA
jgi:hypothetical protein